MAMHSANKHTHAAPVFTFAFAGVAFASAAVRSWGPSCLHGTEEQSFLLTVSLPPDAVAAAAVAFAAAAAAPTVPAAPAAPAVDGLASDCTAAPAATVPSVVAVLSPPPAFSAFSLATISRSPTVSRSATFWRNALTLPHFSPKSPRLVASSCSDG